MKQLSLPAILKSPSSCLYVDVNSDQIIVKHVYILVQGPTLHTRRSFNVFTIFIPSARKTLFFQKKITLFNVQFMATQVAVQTKVNLKVFGDSSARLTATRKLVGMHNNIKQATTHKLPEIFLELIVVFFTNND